MDKRVNDLPALKKRMEEGLQAHACSSGNCQLFLRAFKMEQLLEVWVKPDGNLHWAKLKNFAFCKTSGQPGPKRREGDRQIPEGVYHIDRFNPKSKYHLSLGINYPNALDRSLGDPDFPGSDIFIHGGCETVGCIPITDRGIEEVYLLASWARENRQQKIPVHIFPFHFSEENWNKYGPEFPQHRPFWRSLEEIFLHFERSRQLPTVEITDAGHYYTVK